MEVGREMVRRGRRVVFVLGPVELERLAVGVIQGIRGEFETVERAGLIRLAEVLGEARCYLGNDSGVSQLAGALGVPTVVLFGPSDPRVWRPVGPAVRVVEAPGGDLTRLGVEEVTAALRHRLGEA